MKRPFGVAVLAVVGILSGVYGFASGLLLVRRSWALMEILVPNEPRTWGVLAVGLPCVLGIIYTVTGIGLWRLRKWARGVVILWAILAIGTAVLNVILKTFNPDRWVPPLWLLLPVVGFYGLCLAYMFTRKVKQAFSV